MAAGALRERERGGSRMLASERVSSSDRQRRGRRRGAWALAAALHVAGPVAALPPGPVILFVDADDDDDDGIRDRDQAQPRRAGSEIQWLDSPTRHQLRSIRGRALRVLSGRAFFVEGSAPAELEVSIGVQGLEAGAARVELAAGTLEAMVYEVLALDAAGRRVDLVSSHASLSRALPASLRPAEERSGDESDALRWLVKGPQAGLPVEISIRSTSADGRPLDVLERLPLSRVPCPPTTAAGLSCRASALIRAATDGLDRQHPRAPEPSLHAEVGGRLLVFSGAQKAASIRVGGPRQTRLGPLERYRARLRVRVLRTGAGGGVAVGADEAGGLAVARQEVANANALWGQCGIQFGAPAELDVAVVDPPPPHMLSVGCGLGLPASAGQLVLRVGRRRFEVKVQAGWSPERLANAIAAPLRRAGFEVSLSANPRESFAAHGSVDVLVRGAQGAYVPLEVVHKSGDRLDVCLGEVNLSDGLSHFSDADAAAGTLEERALLKAIADDDPTTIDVLVLPYFVTVGRIGESFVDAAGLGVRNAIIIDRAGVRAGARSFALAHELGHVLLQMAGHPDDFGADLPTSLMDADAADPSIFGPRRLSIAECERAVLQSGPDAPLPLLEHWPLVSRSAAK